MENMMHDLYETAEQNLKDTVCVDDSGLFSVKLVNAYRQDIPMLAEGLHPLYTINDLIEAARHELGLGELPISEMNISLNGYTPKIRPSDTLKSLGLHSGMAEMPVLMIDPSGSNG